MLEVFAVKYDLMLISRITLKKEPALVLHEPPTSHNVKVSTHRSDTGSICRLFVFSIIN